jgi:hypothetical protein
LPRKARAMSAIVSRSPLITPVAFTWLGRSSWLTARKQGLQVTRCRWAALSRSALQFGIGWVLGFCSAARSSTRARRRRGPPHSHRRRTSSALQQSQWYGARRDMWDPSATALILETGQRSDSMRRAAPLAATRRPHIRWSAEFGARRSVQRGHASPPGLLRFMRFCLFASDCVG